MDCHTTAGSLSPTPGCPKCPHSTTGGQEITHSMPEILPSCSATRQTRAMPPTRHAPTTMTATCPASITSVWNTSVQMTAFSPPWGHSARHHRVTAHGRGTGHQSRDSPAWCRACRPAPWSAPRSRGQIPSLEVAEGVNGVRGSSLPAWPPRPHHTCVEGQRGCVEHHSHVDNLRAGESRLSHGQPLKLGTPRPQPHSPSGR